MWLGSSFYIPDTLSWYPAEAADEKDDLKISEIEVFESQFMAEFRASDTRIQEVLQAQMADTTCKKLKKLVQKGWPWKPSAAPVSCRAFWSVQGELSIIRGLLMKGTTLVIPTALRKGILTRIHIGHMGTKKCIERARATVWWPGITNDIKTCIFSCETCLKEKTNIPEPLIPSPLSQAPLEVVGTDLAERKGKHYII
ncbi:hypothetical protein PR048_013570 [Dryococelus australis]|uniref:RNA-directed DNA polymerase n=1 Tax=Dryococelus australis TaxID=614101 RepID=A0ABQ9HSJ9_9NEOP|nr:hypothetical protein PR048_013570 [Dryococelus australis]